MRRREFARSVAVAIAKRAAGRCEQCGVEAPLELHHKTMDAMEADKSRKLTIDDGEMLCKLCHREITKPQRVDLARALAREASHLGVRPEPARKIQSRPPSPRKRPPKPPLPPRRLYADS